jgi:4,5-dihydroxyphthalate decarboxylase
MSDTARSRPVLTGQVPVAGVDIRAVVGHPSDLFWRQLGDAEFDASEMSLSSLAIVREAGRDDFVALPVFPVRRFFHAGMLVNADAHIDTPADLAGKRIGVPEYQQTAAVWVRGFLSDEAGVTPSDVTWFMEREAAHSHAHVAGSDFPADVDIRHIGPGDSIASLLERGELDAALHYIAAKTGLDRSVRRPDELHGVRRLFPDAAAEIARYYAKSGVVPMNHCVVLHRRIHDRQPWVAAALYEAFRTAAARAAADFADTLALWRAGQPDGPASSIGTTHPYGVAANRHSLGTLARYLVEQGLTRKPFDPDGFFAPECPTDEDSSRP